MLLVWAPRQIWVSTACTGAFPPARPHAAPCPSRVAEPSCSRRPPTHPLQSRLLDFAKDPGRPAARALDSGAPGFPRSLPANASLQVALERARSTPGQGLRLCRSGPSGNRTGARDPRPNPSLPGSHRVSAASAGPAYAAMPGVLNWIARPLKRIVEQRAVRKHGNKELEWMKGLGWKLVTTDRVKEQQIASKGGINGH